MSTTRRSVRQREKCSVFVSGALFVVYSTNRFIHNLCSTLHANNTSASPSRQPNKMSLSLRSQLVAARRLHACYTKLLSAVLLYSVCTHSSALACLRERSCHFKQQNSIAHRSGYLAICWACVFRPSSMRLCAALSANYLFLLSEMIITDVCWRESQTFRQWHISGAPHLWLVGCRATGGPTSSILTSSNP